MKMCTKSSLKKKSSSENCPLEKSFWVSTPKFDDEDSPCQINHDKSISIEDLDLDANQKYKCESTDPEIINILSKLPPISLLNFSEILEPITGEYTYNYDIFSIHVRIMTKFEKNKLKISDMEKNLENLSKKLLIPQTILCYNSIKKSMESIKDEIKSIQNNTLRDFYLKESFELLQEFQKIKFSGIGTISIDIMDRNGVVSDEISSEIKNKIRIIEDYIEIAEKYIKINIIRKIPRENKCINCGERIIEDFLLPTEDLVQKCSSCDVEFTTLSFYKNNKENTKSLTSFSMKEDKSIENFMKAFMKYQGLHEEKPPENLYIELEKYFISMGLPTGSEIKKLPLNKRKRRGNTNHKTIHTALAALGGIYTKYYEDTNYIGHIYFGWELPNFIDQIELCIEIYNETQSLYYDIPVEDRDRDSSLGTQFRLFKTLQLVGYECYEDEFKIADNLESKRNHYRLWKMICNKSTNPLIYYIDT